VATKNLKFSFNITAYEFIILNTKIHKCHVTNKTHTSVIYFMKQFMYASVAPLCKSNMIILEFKIKDVGINAF
jgi:hypothetical protein